MAGYSGTPLHKKLGIKAGHKIALLGTPVDVRSVLGEALRECTAVNKLTGPLDFVHLFSKSRSELETQVKLAAKTLAPAGML